MKPEVIAFEKENRKMKTATLQLPAFWASFLVNGDKSSLSASEQAFIAAHLKAHGLRAADCLSCDDEYFSKNAKLGAGTYCDYVFATK